MHTLDLRDRFKCLANRDGLDRAIKSCFGINKISYTKESGNYSILVSGGLKQEGENFNYNFSLTEKDALDNFFYYELFSFLHKKEGDLIWRRKPEVRKSDENKFYIYSRLLINQHI